MIDATETVALNAARARSFRRELLLLVVSAENCPGCERLDAQLREAEVRCRLAGRAYLVGLKAGDLHHGADDTLKIGSWTLRSPGFPTIWVFRLGDDRLDFHALALGPLDEAGPAEDVNALLAGESRWVPEAGGATAEACGGAFCLPLTARGGFQATFSIPMIRS